MVRFVRRKWGWYFVLLNFPQFKVKLLRFHRGKSLSLQYHQLRNELWLFLSGVGFFHKNGNAYVMGTGESVLVEKGQKHKYACSMASWVIEVQFGDKCIEEDIIRL